MVLLQSAPFCVTFLAVPRIDPNLNFSHNGRTQKKTPPLITILTSDLRSRSTMDITFVQAQFCCGDAVKDMVVVEMKVSTSHLKTWTVSEEYQEWEDDEGQFAVTLYNPVR